MTTVERLKAKLHERIAARSDVQSVPTPVGPCIHLGGPTGETVQCPTCRGVVQLKVLSCAGGHTVCTPTKKVAGVACCATCPDRSPEVTSGE